MKYKHVVDMRYQQYGPEMSTRVPYNFLYYTIGGLMSYEYYQICVAPIRGVRELGCSNSLKLLTGESGQFSVK